MTQHTKRPWISRAVGGHSVVLCPDLPARNDSRASVGYGYGNEAFSVGYPFLDDDDRVRMDFVCFSHDDARMIAAAPELLEALKGMVTYFSIDAGQYDADEPQTKAIANARAAIAKAKGGAA